MKTKLQLLIALFLLFSINLFSQNIWIGEGTDTNWSNVDNWSAGMVPVPSDNVLIPTGFNVNADSLINVLSLTVEGNSVLNIQSGITFSNPCVFRQNTTINYFDGNINGQGGIITSEGTINVMITNLFNLSNSTTLNNLGTINFISGFFGITGDSVLNNSGTIDFKGDNFMISASSTPNVLNNTGLIKTSFLNPIDEGFIGCPLINTGTLQVETGVLNLNSTVVNLNGGLYNVAAGASLNWNSPTTVSGILSGNVFGALNWNDDLIVPTTVFFNFGGNQIINCTGNLEGGGTLTNQTTINQIGGSTLQIDGITTLDNEGIIQITNGTGIAIGTNSIINNNAAGVIDIQVDGADIVALGGSSPSILNNYGLIKASFQNPTDQSIFRAQLNNNNGTIQVENGTLLLFNSDTTLTDGIYNIETGATLQWTLPITISGTLNGNLNGTLGWEADLLVPSSASFNFAGNGSIDWERNSLTGGGTLTNEHLITMVSGPNKIIDGATTLVNNSEIISSSGFVRIGTNSTLNNTVSGTINIETEAINSSFGTVNSAPHTFINSGLLIASASVPAFKTVISAPINNFGTIEATSTEIEFTNSLVNETSGIIKGAGIIDLPPSGNFINNGVFAPGNSPGILTVVGDFPSTASTQYSFELNGLTQGAEYDLLAIQGNASFEGDVEITLGFDANVNDEFVVATTSNTINVCNLPTTATSSFGGFDYNFDVLCRNNDELVLTVTNETLSILENSDNLVAHIYPNPATDIVRIETKNDIDSIKIFDMRGKLLLLTKSNSLSVESLSIGIYILKITDIDGKVSTQKLIKK